MNIAMRLAHGPDFERDGGRIFTLGDPKLGLLWNKTNFTKKYFNYYFIVYK